MGTSIGYGFDGFVHARQRLRGSNYKVEEIWNYIAVFSHTGIPNDFFDYIICWFDTYYACVCVIGVQTAHT